MRRAFVRRHMLIGQPVNRKLNDSTASWMVRVWGVFITRQEKNIHGMRLVLLSSSSSQFYNAEKLLCCAEMTYMIGRQLPKACIISIMHSGRLVFAFLRHLSLLHAATLPCISTHCCCWGVSLFIRKTHSFLFLFHPSATTQMGFSYETPDPLSQRPYTEQDFNALSPKSSFTRNLGNRWTAPYSCTTDYRLQTLPTWPKSHGSKSPAPHLKPTEQNGRSHRLQSPFPPRYDEGPCIPCSRSWPSSSDTGHHRG